MTLCTVADVVRFAKITGVLTTDQRTTLDDMISAATPVIERITGPIEMGVRTFTAGSGWAIRLPWRFTTILSITVDGVLVDPALYDSAGGADLGVVYPAVSASYTPWGSGTAVTVVAQVGSPVVPPHVKQAALELVSYWWQSTQQAQRSAWQETVVPMGFAVPARVKELLEPSPALPGFG